MDARVVDASAVAALLFNEPEADSIADQITAARLLAPFLLEFELANVCLIKSRRHPGQMPTLIEAFRLLDQLGVEAMAVDHVGVVTLAAETGLTAYDASYLWLSHRQGAPLVTLDRKLARAALVGR
jgi:predicted nucleic acid-binding protein